MRIVLLGAPGSGKKTQTKRMVERYNVPSISTGELLKLAVSAGSDLGQQVKMSLDAGQSVSEAIVLELIRERLLLPDARDGFILDGFPRNILQAITLDELLAEIAQPLELALMIHIDTDALMERLVGRRICVSCGTQYNIYNNPTAVEGVCDLCGGRLRHRADDNEGTISSRLHVYDHLASSLVKHYTKQQKLKIVDGFGEEEAVFARICQIVDTHEVEPSQATQVLDTPADEMATNLAADHKSAIKLPAGQKQTPGKKKSLVKKSSAKNPANKKYNLEKSKAEKKPVRKKRVAAQKKKVATKEAPVKKKVAAKKSFSAKKAASAKKRPVVARKVVNKKKVVKKKVSKQPVAAKKKTAGTKKAMNKTAKTKTQRSAAKKSTSKKKVSAKKSPVAKKAARKKR